MNVLPVSEFKKLSKEKMLELSPVKVLWDGEEIGVFSKVGDTIVIQDLPIAVQKQFRAREQLVRHSMGIKDVRPDYVTI